MNGSGLVLEKHRFIWLKVYFLTSPMFIPTRIGSGFTFEFYRTAKFPLSHTSLPREVTFLLKVVHFFRKKEMGTGVYWRKRVGLTKDT